MTTNRITLSGTFMASLLFLAACDTPVSRTSHPEMTFTHLAPINLNAATVVVENTYRRPASGAYVEDRIPVSPATAIARWTKDRLKPVGNAAAPRLRVIIKNAGVKETDLKRDTSLKGTFTKQQSHRYDFAAEASVELTDASGRNLAHAEAGTTRMITVREDFSVNEREKAWYGAVESLMSDFNAVMEANIRRYFAAWIR